MTFTFDSNSGRNGDVLHMHISGALGATVFVLKSTLDGRSTVELAVAK